jgi:hypothetical protein
MEHLNGQEKRLLQNIRDKDRAAEAEQEGPELEEKTNNEVF